MVVRSIRQHVRAHDWFAVAVDLEIVVAGVFIANQVSDWNVRRTEDEQARSYRERLAEELDFNARQFEAQIAYYLQAQAYGRQALASLAGETPLSDRDFLIAAYQLSQTDSTPAKTYIYDEMTANGLVTRLGSPRLQQFVSDYYLGLNASNRVVAEEHAYRSSIRATMPYDVQKRIRDVCGDREVRYKGRLVGVKVIVPCPVQFDPVAARIAVQTVRAKPGLTEEMTRYIASLDEKLDQLRPGVDFSRALGVQLAKASVSHAP